MSKLSFNVKLLETNNNISQNMLKALLPDLNKYFDKVYARMTQTIPKILIQHIKAQPEYDSLMGGKLMIEFGIPDPGPRLAAILNTIESGAIVQTKPISIVGGKLKGSIKIQMVQKDFADLLSLGESSFTTEKGSRLEWLKWLLLEGDTIIIADHTFILGPSTYSRTGMGIMRENTGGFWRVPPEYAGSIGNNWITRAIDSASKEIATAISKSI